MSKKIFEEKGGPHRGHAAGDTDVEKQASQLASDVKYKVKQSMSGSTNLSPAQVTRAYLSQLSKSPSSPSVKALAKKKLMGSSGSSSEQKNEDYTEINLSQIIEQSVVSALTKVFIDHETVKVDEVKNEYLNSLLENEDRKYKVRVTDKKTGNSYVRFATREKISELRSNPNISSVEMTSYGDPVKGEKDKGEQTSKTKSGKGLDPVGQEDKDIDNDGDHDKSDKYLINRRKVRGTAIAKKTGEVKEEFLGEVKRKKDENKVQETGVNNYKNGTIKMFPEIKESSYSRFLKVIQEKAVSQNQQQLAGMALAYLRGDMPDASDEVKKMAKMGEKKLRDFAKTKHEGLPEKVKEEADCGCDDKKTEKEIDPRQLKTMKDRTRTSLGLMGIKASYEPEGNTISERENDEPGESDNRPDVKAHNRAVGYKPKARRPDISKDPRYGSVSGDDEDYRSTRRRYRR